MEKIAVHCKSEDLFLKTIEKAKREGQKFNWDDKTVWNNTKEKTVIFLSVGAGLHTVSYNPISSRNVYHPNHKIIEAEDYLKEGGEKMKFKVGDNFRHKNEHCTIKIVDIKNQKYVTNWEYDRGVKYENHPYNEKTFSSFINEKTSTQIQKEESNMKKCIEEVYDKTKDANLVEAHSSAVGLGSNEFVNTLWLQNYKTAVLVEAERLEAKRLQVEADKKD